jgi:type VI secretion system secreted protein VgrG
MSQDDDSDFGEASRDAAVGGATEVAVGAVQDPSAVGAAAQQAGTGAATDMANAGLAEAGVPPEVAGAATSVAAGAISGGGAGAANAATGAAGGLAGSALGAAGAPPMVAGAAGAVVSAGAGAVAGGARSPGSSAQSGSTPGSHPGDMASAAATLSASVLRSVDETAQAEFLFECEGSDIPWVIASVAVDEAINNTYTMVLDLRTGDMSAEGGQLLGQSCSLLMERSIVQHRVSGIISRVTAGSTARDQVSVIIQVVPAVWALTQRKNSRIFQNMTVPDILKAVIEEALGPYQREVVFELERTYDPCEYRVQYDETDMAFVSRLAQEEGLAFWFDQEDATETLVFADVPAKYRELTTLHERELDFVTRDNAVEGKENVREFHMVSQIMPTAVATRHFDWTHPSTPIEASMKSEAQAADEPVHGAAVGPVRELYEHDSKPLTLTDFDPTQGYQKQDSEVQVGLRHEVQKLNAHIASGKSTAVGMMPGVAFDLLGHPQPELDGRYVVLTVKHHGLERGSGESDEAYYNTFTCMRAEQMYRPKRTADKPRVPGLQTATVVGPADKEIYTDEHGRVLVQFHWDRLGKRDEHSSCFIRVMQPWAGAGWGFVFLPRIGMEVTVAFLNGDPDQPLITGTVYNAENLTPYTMPDEMTKSTIKTRSSPGGEGYNELTFEDKAGEEQIIVHAQKDYVETVENDHTTTVHGNSANSVDGGHSESVGGDASLGVKGERTVTVTGNQTVTVESDHTLDVKHNILVKAPDSIKLECGDSIIEMVPGKITITTAGSKVELTADIISTAANGAYQQLKDFAKMQSAQGSEVFLDANGLYQSSGGSKVHLTANAEMGASGGGTVLLDANAAVSGGTASVTGETEATLAAGGTVKADAAGVAVSGTTVDLNGSGMVQVQGAVVKLN